MLSTVKCLVKSGTNLKTFNSNNRWEVVDEFASITPDLVKTKGMAFDSLITPVDNIKLLWTKLKDNEDGSAIYYSEDITKAMNVQEIAAINEDGVDKLKLTVAQFIPKDKISASDIIYSYSTDPEFQPQIVNVSYTSQTVHDENIQIMLDTVYNYDTKVKYAVKINGGQYSEWTTEKDPFEKVAVSILNKDLQLGKNTITIKVATLDELKFSEKVLTEAITVSNSQPSVSIIDGDSDAFKVHFRISDEDVRDTIQYKLTLSNTKGTFLLQDWTDPVVQPIETVHYIDTKNVVIDKINTIKIEYKDNFGGSGSSDYTFTGKYNNVVFTDEEGDYYVTDKGAMLKMLQFDDLPAGKTTPAKKILLKNSSSTAIQNLTLRITDITNEDGIKVQLSKTEYPFEPSTTLDFGSQIIQTGETLPFYARIDTEMSARGTCEFSIEANSDIANSPLRYLL